MCKGQAGVIQTSPDTDDTVAIIESCLHDWLDDRLECDERGFAVYLVAKLYGRPSLPF